MTVPAGGDQARWSLRVLPCASWAVAARRVGAPGVAAGVAVAAGDQGPAPAMLRARTWTWCAVSLASPAMVAVVPAAAVGTDHSPPEGRYRIW